MKQMSSAHKHIVLEIQYVLVVIADFILRVRRVIREFLAKNAILQLRAYKSSLALANEPLTQAYCAFNRNAYKDGVVQGAGIILIDCMPIPAWIAQTDILADCLARSENAQLCSYDNSPRVPLVDVLYKSFGCNTHLLVRLTKSDRKKRRELFFSCAATIQTKQDLFNLMIDGNNIGLEIYETILRQFNKPTVDVNSFISRYVLFSGLNYYLYFKAFFAENKVKAVILSHPDYISMGILAKTAWVNGVPVYFTNAGDVKRTTGSRQQFHEFQEYRDYFKALTPDEQLKGIEWGQRQLNKRLGGQESVNMFYDTKSAYTIEKIGKQTLDSRKTKIVIASHCFFDNPSAYGGMLFLDFYEWISFLGELSEVTDYDWYIKPHRKYLPGTIEIIESLCKRWPKIKLINPEATWYQLKDEGVSIALTCYGTVGHELPQLGYKVINSGYNPHIAYDFNWHAKSIDEYRNMIMHIETLGEIENLDSTYEFYFVHYNLTKKGGILFDSLEELESFLKEDGMSNKVFEIVLNGGKAYHDKTKEIISEFLDSDALSISALKRRWHV